MNLYHELHDYIKRHTNEITDQWLYMRGEDVTSYYSSKSSASTEQLREENFELIQSLSKVFISEKTDPNLELKDWAERISEKRAGEQVPIHQVLEQFSNFRKVLWDYVKGFAIESDLSLDQAMDIGQMCNNAQDYVIYQFSKHYYETSIRQIHTQQQLINELSAPVIPITDQEAIIPLIGDLDPERTKHIQEHTLAQCNQHPYETLFLDMSGVQNIDTLVAHHLYQLIQSLDLLGVKSVICGMNPRVAQVAIQLGIHFSNVPIKSTLYHALDEISFFQNRH
ncbi:MULTISPECIES: STAS domain-containing protein [Pontibacillus]|uniref:STAS domain-containing protein n=1 Tax=Pontibacillus chungwhensis TaxID=265426 RepID=A0ABY8UZ17_9BACI|nr:MULTISPECIES: STAS domain-containing protein [Pontibacillus]MCD5325501.1 STAS domain-containing protein [Pontibacillus sp. HN14]WIF98613.1 STAS domain-containing protein [Pontibacillus chungwhensis]